MPITFRQAFAAWLKHARETQDLKQLELAKRSGVPQSTVSAIENGSHTITDQTIDKLASGLGVTTIQVCDGLAAWSRTAAQDEERKSLGQPPRVGEMVRLGKRSYVTPRVRGAKAEPQPTPVPLSPGSRHRRHR